MNHSTKFLTIAFAAAIAFCTVSCQKEAVETVATPQANTQNTTAKVVYLEDQLLDLSKKEDAETFAAFMKDEPNKGSVVEVKSGEKTTFSQASVRWFKNKDNFHKYALKNNMMTEAQVNKEVEMAKNPEAFKTENQNNNSLETRAGWQNFTAKFYYHCNYGGNYLQFGSSNGYLPTYTAYLGNYWNDQISSMILDNWNNSKGVYVTLYEHSNYSGYWTRVYMYPRSFMSDACFTDGVDYKNVYGSIYISGYTLQNWNDRISSIYINNF
jgi:hypothetical protein